MVFILGVNFNESKLVKKALESFYALGPTVSSRIMAKYSIHKLAKVGALAPRTVTSLTAELSQMTLGTDAKRLVQDNIRRLKDIEDEDADGDGQQTQPDRTQVMKNGRQVLGMQWPRWPTTKSRQPNVGQYQGWIKPRLADFARSFVTKSELHDEMQ